MHQGLADIGHYYVLIKQDDKWHKYSDANVTQIEESEVISLIDGSDESNDSAYWLMYQQTPIHHNKYDSSMVPDRILQKIE